MESPSSYCHLPVIACKPPDNNPPNTVASTIDLKNGIYLRIDLCMTLLM